MKAALTERSPKTVNNVLTTLSVLVKTAVEWGVVEGVPCSIRLLRTPKSAASFYDFDEYEPLVETARTEPQTCLAVLLGGDAGLREARSCRWSGRTSISTSANCAELAGHQDLRTTQRYMHLSPAAIEAAMRLLERDVETARAI
jgi:hypothetical protein